MPPLPLASTSRATVARAAPPPLHLGGAAPPPLRLSGAAPLPLRLGGAAPLPLRLGGGGGGGSAVARRPAPPAASRRSPPPEDDRRGSGHEERLGPQAVTSLRELREGAHWALATVLRNDAVSLDGGSRMLHLSIADDAPVLYGRRVQGVQDPLEHKWVESFTTPGAAAPPAARRRPAFTGGIPGHPRILPIAGGGAACK